MLASLPPTPNGEGPWNRPASIINIGSVDGIRVPSLETYAYSASKAGRKTHRFHNSVADAKHRTASTLSSLRWSTRTQGNHQQHSRLWYAISASSPPVDLFLVPSPSSRRPLARRSSLVPSTSFSSLLSSNSSSSLCSAGPFETKMMAATLAAARDTIIDAVPLARIGTGADVGKLCPLLAMNVKLTLSCRWSLHLPQQSSRCVRQRCYHRSRRWNALCW